MRKSKSIAIGLILPLLIGAGLFSGVLPIPLVARSGLTFGPPGQKPIMAYYIYYREGLARQIGEERYDHAFATYEEAERARQKAAIDTRGDAENFLRSTYIKEVPTGRYTTPPPDTSNPAPGSDNRPPTATPPESGKTPVDPKKPEAGGNVLPGPLKPGGTDSARTGDPVVDASIVDLSGMTSGVVPILRGAIDKRKTSTNISCTGFRRTLKIKAPPPPYKTFSQIEPGDVLLVHPDGFGTRVLRFTDRLTSMQFDSNASHAFVCVKIVNGVKLFLDAQPFEGPRIKSESEILARYGGRDVDVAQPVSRFDAEALWNAARELGMKEISTYLKQSQRPVQWTNFGLYGNDDMVCSEVSRWALLKAGAAVGQTRSPLKIFLGIDFGPANFYSDTDHFMMTPMEWSPKPAGR